MEMPESISDVGAAYLQDMREVVPISALATLALSLGLSVTCSSTDVSEGGVWLLAALTPISTLLKADGGVWAFLHLLDIPLGLLCAGVALLISEVFRRVAFWAITSSGNFKSLERSQHQVSTTDKDSTEKRSKWIDDQISKSLSRLKKKDSCAEIISGVASTALIYGQLTVLLDLAILLATLLIAYICVQSSAKDYVSKVYPFVLMKANLAGFVHTESKR